MTKVDDGAERRDIMMVGLPEAGKTSFLVALYHVAMEKDVPGALRLQKFDEGDRAYIENLRTKWQRYESSARTHPEHTHDPILLSLQGTNGTHRLRVPDLSGETFRDHVEKRYRPKGFGLDVAAAGGFLLYINPLGVKDALSTLEMLRSQRAVVGDKSVGTSAAPKEQNREPQKRIDEPASEPAGEKAPETGLPTGPPATADEGHDTEPVADESGPKDAEPSAEKKSLTAKTLAAGVSHSSAANSSKRKKLPTYEPKLAPTVVKFVELLQFLSSDAASPVRLAVVVSALDSLDATYKDDPAGFLESPSLSLLDQFLKANPELFEFRVFGISAQGADYNSGSADLSALQASTERASQRIRVVGEPEGHPNDISRPIKWLVGELGE